MSDPVSTVLYTRVTPALKRALLEKADRMHLKLADLIRVTLANSLIEDSHRLVDTPTEYRVKEPA